MHHRAWVAERHCVVLPVRCQLLDAINHLLRGELRPRVELALLGLAGRQHLDVRPADVDHQDVHVSRPSSSVNTRSARASTAGRFDTATIVRDKEAWNLGSNSALVLGKEVWNLGSNSEVVRDKEAARSAHNAASVASSSDERSSI